METGTRMRGRVLIIAGSDSGGGAGIQADVKTVTALGGYAATAITALTAQNTVGVHGIAAIDPAFIALQMRVVMEDIGADVIKTGMLGSAEVVVAVADELARSAPHVRLVVDPVMVAKSGDFLLAADAVTALRERLVARAYLVTPNLPEAAALTGRTVETLEEMKAAAHAIQAQGARAVLVKGGHLAGAQVVDVLAGASVGGSAGGDGPEGSDGADGGTRVTSVDGARAQDVLFFDSPRLAGAHTHGTGCTLASAIATGLAQGLSLTAAVTRARAYVARAIATAPGLGRGHGPLNHAHTVDRAAIGLGE